MTTSTETKTERVERLRHFFDQPENYLSRRKFDIRVRVETTQAFVKGTSFTRILDIGCGDGSISTPLLSTDRHLTLLDIAPNMLASAQARVPDGLSANVDSVNGDFLTDFPDDRSYDLIICIGFLAHVSGPEAVIAKISKLLRPGGILVLEFTDSTHFSRRLLSFYHSILGFFRSTLYRVTPFSKNHVLDVTAKHGFAKLAEFRYTFPWPGIHRIVSQDTLYQLVRKTFGDVQHNRNTWLGSEYICCLRRT